MQIKDIISGIVDRLEKSDLEFYRYSIDREAHSNIVRILAAVMVEDRIVGSSFAFSLNIFESLNCSSTEQYVLDSSMQHLEFDLKKVILKEYPNRYFPWKRSFLESYEGVLIRGYTFVENDF